MTADGELTGNDYVSIPSIDSGGGMDAINVLHAASAGLIEWSGGAEPLLRPRITFDGAAVDMKHARWKRVDRWIPVFTVALPDGSTVTGTICAPGGYPPARGFLIRIEAENRGRAPGELRVELDVHWTSSHLRIASARPLPGRNVMFMDAAAGALALEVDDGRGPALAIGTSHPADVSIARGTDAWTVSPSTALAATNGDTLRARISQSVQVRSGSRAGAAFYVGAGRERDGALAAAAVLRRAGPDHWLRQARLELSHTLRSAQDHRWADMLNRNLLFARYYAVGRAIDDDRLYLLRSRSPFCPAPAIFNEREALLWTLPALIMADPALAREALFRTLELASERSGEFLRYLDGGAWDAGFVLDQFLLYAWAIDHFVSTTGDVAVLDEPLIRQILLETDGAAFMRLHPQHLLAGTELLPSGDVADYPFATMANVLLWAFSDRLPGLLGGEAGNGADPPARFHNAAGEIAAAVWHHCVSEVDGHPILASSASLEGEAAVYDDPALSLAMVPFFGFCTDDDPVWRATMEFIRSPRYPLWRAGNVPGLAARAGSKHPRTAALCADLLTWTAPDALDRLLRVYFPGGVAAAEYDADSGAAGEPHHAALAGFVSWALVRAAEPAPKTATRRRKRR